MRALCPLAIVLGMSAWCSELPAQPEPRGGRGGPPQDSSESFIARMMSRDKDGDGQLTREEIADGRLDALFRRADADGDGRLTRPELQTLFAKEGRTIGRRPPPRRGGPPGPPPGGRIPRGERRPY